MDRLKERWFEAHLRRFKGEALLGLTPDHSAEAEAHFHQALVVARDQGARVWELRAATSLARLWAEQGERQKAHDLLAPIYSWFTEGFDTADRWNRPSYWRSSAAAAPSFEHSLMPATRSGTR